MAREGFQYFVERYLETGEARSLWRRKRFGWQYLSLIDWNWHRVWPWRVRVPAPDDLHSITARQAADLGSDRQQWVQYWAKYRQLGDWNFDRLPLTVLRRRVSPGRQLDEIFSIEDHCWKPTKIPAHHLDPRGLEYGLLWGITSEAADEFLSNLTGSTGTIEQL